MIRKTNRKVRREFKGEKALSEIVTNQILYELTKGRICHSGSEASNLLKGGKTFEMEVSFIRESINRT